MGNRFDVKKLSYIAVLIIVIAGAVLGYFVYTNLILSPTDNVTSTKTIQLKTDEYKSLTAIKDYGQKVTTTEPGYGRANPFGPTQ